MKPVLPESCNSKPTTAMEERRYSSMAVPTEYLQHWVQSTQHMQALQALQLQQMASAAHLMEAPNGHRAGPHPAAPLQPISHPAPHPGPLPETPAVPAPTPTKGKRGRPKEPKEPKAKPGPKPKKAKEAKEGQEGPDGKQEKIDEAFKKVKRKVDRFKGMSEAEVMAKTLPDILTHNLDFVIIGINPGLMAAYIGRWFPGPGNHFWKCLFMSGITETQLNHMHDQTLPEKYSIGFTNMVARTTPGSKDLSSKELREGGKILVEKLKQYKPLIAVFNGKCIYEMFSREIFGFKPKKLEFGLQPHKVPDTETVCYLMPSSSARCAQFPRAQDKVHFYIKLMELRDQLKGVAKNREVEEVQYTFDLGKAKEDAKRMAIKEEMYDPGYEMAYGGAYSETGAGDVPAKETPAKAVGSVPDGQWIMQSFADQIPEISGSTQPQPGAETA
ncbi:hypothetical protein JZ751_003458 [Albula glossodonta]|uniref:G/T mismatch-specific thymine DNA glycosylase n=1 Tax=Albula glossodonta TaxID=121402 RepID=A0A8T2MPU9_9TELE|nr:hypothetical protein JZ751_003458 [Albula glossodonta]